MENVNGQTPMREIEIFGIPALFTEQRTTAEKICDMHCYELFSAEDGTTFLGTVLTPVPVELPESNEKDVYEGDIDMDASGNTLSPEQFAEKWLSPLNGPDLGERYGKED